MRKTIVSIGLSLGLAIAASIGFVGSAAAHHSFAAFFDNQKNVTITGKVTGFQFVNPHGIIELEVKDAAGKVAAWRVETNSPSILRRAGWTKDSLVYGQTVTILGWPARDGANYMRLQRATDDKGQPIGRPFGAGDQQ